MHSTPSLRNFPNVIISYMSIFYLHQYLQQQQMSFLFFSFLFFLWAQFQCCFSVHRNHKDSLGLGAQDVHLDFHTAPELWPLGYRSFSICFTSTETIRTIRYRKPRTSNSTFSQLLSSVLHSWCIFRVNSINFLKSGFRLYCWLINFSQTFSCMRWTPSILTVAEIWTLFALSNRRSDDNFFLQAFVGKKSNI